MKIGIIGLGNIAQKAYLPIYAQLRDKAMFVLSTRNEQTRSTVSEKYGFTETVSSTEALIQTGITACFVHTATQVHDQVVKQLLEAGIHVFVDKPLSENLAEVKKIQTLAAEKKRLLMVGFNRRFAPFVEKLKAVENKNMLLLQKNRVATEYTANFVIYDLFLHLADTAVYLLDDDIGQVQTKIIEENGLLKRAFLHIETETTTVIASMNLFAGANTETYQLTSPEGTFILENLTDLTIKNRQGTQQENFPDWAPAIEKRGFQQMVEEFIEAINLNDGTHLKQEKIFTSHELCAQMIRQHQQHIL